MQLPETLRASRSIDKRTGFPLWLVSMFLVHRSLHFLYHFFSLPVPPGASADFPEFEILINDSVTPIWGYCSQVGHCAGGMVFSINAPSAGNTYSAFQQLAIESNITNPVIPPIAGGVVTTSTPLIHHITVGGTPGLIYDAPNITVQVNEIVRFHMKLSNHTGAIFGPCPSHN
jgi:hypothetical protein